jgi:3'-phosphoadenosine 5'-phosphosulfate (PAPS) 3'-phosphatase
MTKLPKLTARELAFQARLINELVLSSLLSEVAELMRRAAEEILRPNFGKVAAEQKMEFGLLEPVTAVDKKISAFLLEAVRTSLPGSYSEEELPPTSKERRRESLLWQFDPLDGNN